VNLILDPSIQDRLAGLPRHITRAQIAFLAGVTEFAVAKWARREGFPRPVDLVQRRYRYPTEEVVVWLAGHLASELSGTGQQLRRPPNRLSLTDPRRLKDAEIAQLLGVTAAKVTAYARRYEGSATPFPARDAEDRRSVAEVAQWFKNHQPKRGRGPAAGLARTAPGTADQQRELVAKRFAELPERCYLEDIVRVTGTGTRSVARWLTEDGFPAPAAHQPARGGRGGKPRFEYSTSDVAHWCLKRMFGSASSHVAAARR
jgi:predicted DNA-binding transcriptional regulator AlpA